MVTPVVAGPPAVGSNPESAPRGRRTALILGVSALVVAGAAVGAVLVTRSNDDKASTSTAAPSVSATSAVGTVTPTLTVASSTTQPSVVTTELSTTVATAVPTTVFDPTAIGEVPASAPWGGPGSPQVLFEPMPSGPSYSMYASSLAIAQQLGDALANDDWNTARRLEPGKGDVSDSRYLAGYDGLDRVSLVLVDVRPEGAGYRLLVVSVANERAGARTTLYCLEWSVDPFANTVVQHNGVVGQIARVDGAVSPEAARLDPALDTTMRTQCVWS